MGASLSLGKTLSVHGEWATHKRRTYVPTRQTAQFMRFGTPGHPVDELVIYGSQLKGVMGTGTIRKLTLVDKADTHAQDGASWNASVSLKDLGKTGWDAVSSVGAGVKGGDSSKVVDGKAEFKCDGVEILEPIERITAETYDRRYGVNATKHFTSAGDAAAAYAPAYSGRLELGEDSVGFELPNVMFHEKTETTSQQITRRDAEQAALEAQRQREAAQRAADAAEELQRNALKAICDQFEAENPTLVKDLIAKEAAEAEAQRAAEAQRQREAAQRAAEAAQDTELQKEKINEALMNILTPGQLQESVTDAKEAERVKIREASIALIRRLRPEVTDAEAQQLRDMYDRKSGRLMNAAMEAYRGSTAENVLHRVSEVIGTVTGELIKGAALAPLDPYETREEWAERSREYDEMKGPMQYLGDGLHATTKEVGHYGLGMSEENAETFATLAMDGVNIATAGRMLKPGVKPALNAAGTVLKGAGGAATAMFETLLSLLRDLEVKAPPAIATPLEIATAGEARAAAAAQPAAVAEAAVSSRPLSLPYIEGGRYVPGKAMMSFELTNPPVLMRGTHNSAGKVPLEVAQKLSGKEFSSFDAFRSEFWKTMAESSYAKEFKSADIARMQKGNAPIVHLEQSLGSRITYELHHRTPIHDGGPVYDLSNLLIVTPKYHKEILSKQSHYGVK
ncbi:HNH endonuclease signature motif containing protein [Candidatus Bodocaedibacter vickermanii]|uniref:Toxin with colicin-like bacteriocin tRNase domain n=1 Tax=Candidatus Bodocaedibacter vickermanii TaxID=2741701 RepID=A0A7L9RSD5_9PROT|nr:Putative toxin with colicin-like bacteriocin tRNase domain [Candidatus Paracaedibacteraceae bacterium 'Lake Konstanz']